MREGVADIFQITFEVGQYYMGYENPSNIYDFDQKKQSNEQKSTEKPWHEIWKIVSAPPCVSMDN